MDNLKPSSISDPMTARRNSYDSSTIPSQPYYLSIRVRMHKPCSTHPQGLIDFVPQSQTLGPPHCVPVLFSETKGVSVLPILPIAGSPPGIPMLVPLVIPSIILDISTDLKYHFILSAYLILQLFMQF